MEPFENRMPFELRTRSTIRKPDMSGFRIPTVEVFIHYSEYLPSKIKDQFRSPIWTLCPTFQHNCLGYTSVVTIWCENWYWIIWQLTFVLDTLVFSHNKGWVELKHREIKCGGEINECYFYRALSINDDPLIQRYFILTQKLLCL